MAACVHVFPSKVHVSVGPPTLPKRTIVCRRAWPSSARGDRRAVGPVTVTSVQGRAVPRPRVREEPAARARASVEVDLPAEHRGRAALARRRPGGGERLPREAVPRPRVAEVGTEALAAEEEDVVAAESDHRLVRPDARAGHRERGPRGSVPVPRVGERVGAVSREEEDPGALGRRRLGRPCVAGGGFGRGSVVAPRGRVVVRRGLDARVAPRPSGGLVSRGAPAREEEDPRSPRGRRPKGREAGMARRRVARPGPAARASLDCMRLHVVDGTYELFRAHFSPRPGPERNKATIGLAASMLALVHDEAEAVTHIAIAFDNPIRSIRNDWFDDYKTDDGSPAADPRRSSTPPRRRRGRWGSSSGRWTATRPTTPSRPPRRAGGTRSTRCAS